MKRLFQVCSVILLLAVGAFSQSITATISGTAKDQSGAVLPGVEITATNKDTSLNRTVITNEQGEYVIPQLPVGTYEVAASLPGFKTDVRQNVVLQVDQRVALNFNMQVGELSERLLVTESAPLLQSETSDVGGVIDNRRVVELPLNGRQFESMALLVPGAFSAPQGSGNGFRGGVSIAGAGERETAFTLDGIDMVDTVVHAIIFRPSVDAIQEFKVQTTRYSAENGKFAGGQINVTTKQGTNDVHGTVYEFLRNQMFDAKNFFDPGDQPIPGFKRNNFGGTVGGPIVRDRSFFFFNYEALRLRQSITRTASVPTAAMVNGDFSQVGAPIRDPLTGQQFPGNIVPQNRINSIGQALARYYPKPNLTDPTRNFVSTPVDTRNIDQGTARIDHRFTDSNNIFGRYSYNKDSELDPFDLYNGITNLPGFGRLDDQTATSISIVDTHVFNPGLVGEVRLGYNRYTQSRFEQHHTQNIPGELGIPGTSKYPIDFGFPAVYPTGFDPLGKSGLPTDRNDNTYQMVANLTRTKSTHTMKFGTDIQWLQSNRLNNGSTLGIYRFTGQYSGNSIADLLLGYPNQTSRSLGDSRQPHAAWVYSFFMQDDWKITPRLTLNLGVRWDLNAPPIGANDRWSTFNPVTRTIEIAGNPSVRRDISRPDNYYPELAALAASIKMVDLGRRNLVTFDKNDLAPRLGLAYRLMNNDSLVLRTGYGIYYQEPLLSAPGWKNYPFFVSQTFNANAAAPNISMSDPFPGALAASTVSPAAIPYHLPNMYMQQYNFGIQYQALSNLVIDLGYVGNKTTHDGNSYNINQPLPSPIGSVASRRPYQGFGNISLSGAGGNANFNSLQMRVEKRYTQGLTLTSSYTWSKNIDYATDGGSAGNIGTQNAYDLGGNRGLSAADARHRLVVSYVYQLPFGSGHRLLGNARGFGSWLVSGWEMSGITTLMSGRPFGVVISGDNSNTGASTSDRPNLIGDPKLPSSQRSPDHWINTAAFAIPAKGTFGNLGRNTLTGPGTNNIDASLMKNSRISETKSIQFRAEFFNLANHPNLDFPNNTVNSPQFGKIFTAEFSRQIQFGLKFLY